MRYGAQEILVGERECLDMIDNHPRKLQVWLFIKAYIIDVIKCNIAFLDTLINSINREIRRIFYPVETLFLDRCYDFPVLHKAGCGIMVKA